MTLLTGCNYHGWWMMMDDDMITHIPSRWMYIIIHTTDDQPMAKCWRLCRLCARSQKKSRNFTEGMVCMYVCMLCWWWLQAAVVGKAYHWHSPDGSIFPPPPPSLFHSQEFMLVTDMHQLFGTKEPPCGTMWLSPPSKKEQKDLLRSTRRYVHETYIHTHTHTINPASSPFYHVSGPSWVSMWSIEGRCVVRSQ